MGSRRLGSLTQHKPIRGRLKHLEPDGKRMVWKGFAVNNVRA